MRLFIGIELPQEIKDHIASVVSPLQQRIKGWEHPHDYHMTLLFIGETAPEAVPEITNQLKEITFTPFTLTLTELFFFSRRVMYMGCKPSAEILDLKTKLQHHFPEFYKPETKPFIPHITVKRWQRYEYDELEKKMLENRFEEKSLVIDHLALFKAEKDSDNRKYHVLVRT